MGRLAHKLRHFYRERFVCVESPARQVTSQQQIQENWPDYSFGGIVKKVKNVAHLPDAWLVATASRAIGSHTLCWISQPPTSAQRTVPTDEIQQAPVT